jgi:hypothetical protein
MRRFLSILLIAGAFTSYLHSQKFEWLAGFDGFLDNREYFTINMPQTIFGSRLRAEIGGSLSGTHRLRAGINYLYEFGSEIDGHKPDLTLYYEYHDHGVRLYAGAFPRRELLRFPMALLSDTLHYYRPNMEGLYAGYEWDWGRQNVFLDWTSRQTLTRHERFMAGTSGKLYFRDLFLSNYFVMSHFAGTAAYDPDHSLRDNMGYSVDLGVDISGKTFLDSICFRAGILGSLDRTRVHGDGWHTPLGFLGQASMVFKFAGLSAIVYAGEGQVLLYGDPFYRLPGYTRLDLFVLPFRSGPVHLKIDIGLHFAEGQVDYSQQFCLTFDLGGTIPRQEIMPPR